MEREEKEYEDDDTNSYYCGYINNCKIINNNSHKIILKVNNSQILFEVDTGACETIMNLSQYTKFFTKSPIVKGKRKMKLISGDCLETHGKIMVNVFMKDNVYELELTILNT